MATQICPKCKEDSFTWSIDEEISDLTIWGCYKCSYQAFEDELDERNCSKCGNKTATRLRDEAKVFWWCSTCNKIEIIKKYT